jgi:crotonobetainyl-CoA:carnitine CoA-transferase CaiB-like acyl-CoA transferase
MKSRLHTFLEGIKIVDLSRYLPGPLASLLLNDLGAEVIKVEPPTGDGLKQVGPHFDDGRPAWHASVNAGKKFMTVDFRLESDKLALHDLIATADVLIESFRPGVMASIGFDLQALREKHPALIIVSLSGYGQSGPLEQAAGHDNNYLSTAGFLAGVGSSKMLPSLIFPPLADCLGSMFAMSTILGAIHARHKDGQGCYIDIALADVVSPLMVFDLAGLGCSGSLPLRSEGLLSGGWACYKIYQTLDGREVALGAVEPKFWSAFCVAGGRIDWVERQGEALPQVALINEVAAFFRNYSLQEILNRFENIDCCLTAVLQIQESVQSDYARERGVVKRAIGHPGYEAVFPAWINGVPPDGRQPMSQLEGSRQKDRRSA